jgi:hypothetical protein
MTTTSVNAFAFLVCVVESAKSLAPVFAADAEIMVAVDHRIVDTIAAPPILTSSQSSLMDVPSQAVSNGALHEQNGEALWSKDALDWSRKHRFTRIRRLDIKVTYRLSHDHADTYLIMQTTL